MKSINSPRRAGMETLFQRIDELTGNKERILCAIDGPSASGKTTLAAVLESRYQCAVLSMDDFFLRPAQRTEERLSQPGGNIDYERFRAEALEPLLAGTPFSYRPYDCKMQTLGAELRVVPGRLCVVEGVYSLHPVLSEAYDLRVFLTLDEYEQKRRLTERNAALYPRFKREWIPMERLYFNTFDIKALCDIIIER